MRPDLPAPRALTTTLPGFGAFGTAGAHVFDETHPAFVRIKALIVTRKTLRPLRRGRQYRRGTSNAGDDFRFHGPGELLAWSRILNDVEVLIAVNTNGIAARGSRVELDPRLRPVAQHSGWCATRAGSETPPLTPRAVDSCCPCRAWVRAAGYL